MIVNGVEVPNTDWIIDGRTDTGPWTKEPAWWPRGHYAVHPKAPVTNILCGHWTGGEAGAKRYDDDGPWVVDVMKRRKNTQGKPLNVSCGFIIGACSPTDTYAPVWQVMDIGNSSGVHVGLANVNRRSIGVEIVSCGVPGRTDIRKRLTFKGVVVGRTRTMSQFYKGQINSWKKLAHILTLTPGNQRNYQELCIANHLSDAGIVIPRHVPVDQSGHILTRRMNRREMISWTGVIEHYLMDNTTKIDAGTQCLQACLDIGFGSKQP